VGSGRIAVELCREGHAVTGLDASPVMLGLARERAREAGVEDRLTLLLGDLADPPPLPVAARVLAPFRPLMHLTGDDQRVRTLRRAGDLLAPGGRFAFDVFEPSAADVRKTHDRWLEREPGIWERARWDVSTSSIELSVRARGRISTMRLEWRSADAWRALCEQAGLRVVEAYRGFDGAQLENLPGDHVFVCERGAPQT
jgi:SAM-dependent methyltransferase